MRAVIMEMIISLFADEAHTATLVPEHGTSKSSGYYLCLTTLPTPYVALSVFFLKLCVAGAVPG
jgi:hypothetical protein